MTTQQANYATDNWKLTARDYEGAAEALDAETPYETNAARLAWLQVMIGLLKAEARRKRNAAREYADEAAARYR